MLLLDGANQRVDLQRGVELLVIRLAEVLQEVARPGTAVAPIVGQIGGNLQRVRFRDRNQVLRQLVACELVIVGDARQLQRSSSSFSRTSMSWEPGNIGVQRPSPTW